MLRPRYLPFLSGQYRMAMGLQSLDPADWIEPDENLAGELEEKDRLLRTRHADVFQSRSGSRPAQQETLDLLLDHMVRHHPGLLIRRAASVTLPPTGRTYVLDDWRDAPLDLAGRLVQEDFLLLSPGERGYVLEAASLCFPSRWRLAEKMGHVLADIHDPVPGYAERLSRPVDRFFTHLSEARPVWRVNWSVTDDPTLFQTVRHTRPDATPITRNDVGERLWLRCERQTLRRLPVSGWALFTVKTHVDPIATLRRHPEAAAALAGSIRSLPDAMQGYKNIAHFRRPLLEWLDAAAIGC